MKDCFLSGACGFIGSNLLSELAKKRQVFIYDNLSTGHLENIIDIKTNYNTNSMVWDYHDALKKAGNISTIFHLGIPSSTSLYRNNRCLIGEAISDFIEVLEYCKENDTKLVWASSSSVYNGHNPPHYEGLTPIKNTDFYTEARYFMERLAFRYYDFYGVNSVGLRLFSVYGKNDWRKGQFANLITQYILSHQTGKAFEVYGDGRQTRDFTYVKDVVRAFLLAEKYKKDGAHIFNVGTGNETSVNDMMNLVDKLKNCIFKRKYIENPLKNYVDRTCAATDLSKTFLKFKAEYSLKDGLKDYLKTENWKEAIK
jgi:UDP-glucose 4-epimerase